MIEDLKQICAKDLKIGDYLINLGTVREIEKKRDHY